MKSKIIFGVNFFIFFILFVITFIYNETLGIYDHDYYHPYDLDAYMGRFLPVIVNYILHVTLPSLFNINVADFKTNIFICSLFSLLYMYIIFLITKLFYIFSENRDNILKRKETIFVLPFVFAIVSIDTVAPFMGIAEFTVFLEHGFSYVFYLPFLFIIYNLILRNKNLSGKETIFYGMISLLLGCWVEFINIPTFFSIVIFCLIIITYKRSLLKNKIFICMLSCFFVGFLIYNFRHLLPFVQMTDPIDGYDLMGRLPENLANISNFNREFVKVHFKDYLLFWIIIVSSLTLFWLINLKNGIKENIYYTFLGLCPILSFFFCSYMTIFIQNYKSHVPTFYFSMFYFHTMYYHFIIFTVVIFVGLLYFKTPNKFFKITILIMAVMIFFMNRYDVIFGEYKTNIKKNHQEKLEKYNLEKVVVLYSLFGESAIVREADIRTLFAEYKIDDGKFDLHSVARFYPYFKQTYKNNFIGYRLLPDETVEKEYKRRMDIIGDIDNEYNMFGQIMFTPLKKIDNINLDIEKIRELREKYGEKDFLLKAEAYKYFEKDDYEMAKLLYEKYLRVYDNKDIDVIINLYEIDKILKEIKELKEKKLIKEL